MPQPAPARVPLGSIPAADKAAVVRRIVGAKPVVAPLDVAAFNSAI